MQLDEREIATVLAALRVFQKSQDVLDMSTMMQFEECEPLDNDEIEDLCKRLNCVEGEATGGDWKVIDGHGDPNRLIVGDGDTLIADCYPDSPEELGLPENYEKNALQIVACRDLVRELAGADWTAGFYRTKYFKLSLTELYKEASLIHRARMILGKKE